MAGSGDGSGSSAAIADTGASTKSAPSPVSHGVCRVVLSRWVPTGSVLLLDSGRIDVMPLSGRSFQYKPLGATGDRASGQVIGEYTLEMRNENAHGVITGLSA